MSILTKHAAAHELKQQQKALQAQIEEQNRKICEDISTIIATYVSLQGFNSREPLPFEVTIDDKNSAPQLDITFKKYWTGKNDGGVNHTLGIGRKGELEAYFLNFASVLKNLRARGHQDGISTQEEYTRVSTPLTEELVDDWKALARKIEKINKLSQDLVDGKALEGFVNKLENGAASGKAKS